MGLESYTTSCKTANPQRTYFPQECSISSISSNLPSHHTNSQLPYSGEDIDISIGKHPIPPLPFPETSIYLDIAAGRTRKA